MSKDTQHQKLGCAHVGRHHSKDRTKVHAGRPEPVVLCGFHATHFLRESLNRPA